MLNVGEKIYAPNYGAGTVMNIEYRKVYDIYKNYVIISLVLDDMCLYIPEGKIDKYRIRSIEKAEIIEPLMVSIKKRPIKIEKKWTKRYRQNDDKMTSGIFEKGCEVIRDLYYLRRNGVIPPGELKILSRAENLVASEISLIYDISLTEAINKLSVLDE